MPKFIPLRSKFQIFFLISIQIRLVIFFVHFKLSKMNSSCVLLKDELRLYVFEILKWKTKKNYKTNLNWSTKYLAQTPVGSTAIHVNICFVWLNALHLNWGRFRNIVLNCVKHNGCYVKPLHLFSENRLVSDLFQFLPCPWTMKVCLARFIVQLMVHAWFMLSFQNSWNLNQIKYSKLNH